MKRWLLLLLGILLLAFGISVGISCWQDYRMPPEEVVRTALEKTLSMEEYQYSSQSVRVLDGKEEAKRNFDRFNVGV